MSQQIVAAAALVLAAACWASPDDDLLKDLQTLDSYETPKSVKHDVLDRLSTEAEQNVLICTELARRLGAPDDIGYQIVNMFSQESSHVCRQRVLDVLAVASSRDMWPIIDQLSPADLTNAPEQVRSILLRGDPSLAAALAWQIGYLGLTEFRSDVAEGMLEQRYAIFDEATLADGHVMEWGLVYATVLTELSRKDQSSKPSGVVMSSLRSLRVWLDLRRDNYCDESGCDDLYQYVWEWIDGEVKKDATGEKDQSSAPRAP
jgi:hypothetical protein